MTVGKCASLRFLKRYNFIFILSFFIILNGSVAIHINTTLGVDDEKQEDKQEPSKERCPSGARKDSSVSSGSTGIRRLSNTSSGEEKPKKIDRSKFGNFVGKIGK